MDGEVDDLLKPRADLRRNRQRVYQFKSFIKQAKQMILIFAVV